MGWDAANVWAKWRRPLIVGVSAGGIVWLFAAALLLASWRSGVEAQRARAAPPCAADQEFSTARCMAVRPGLMTRLTAGELDVTVDGRDLQSTVTLAGTLPRTEPAVAVQVTLYRGRVIHVEDAAGLFVDTNAAPWTGALTYRIFGLLALAGGVVVGLTGARMTLRSREAPG